MCFRVLAMQNNFTSKDTGGWNLNSDHKTQLLVCQELPIPPALSRPVTLSLSLSRLFWWFFFLYTLTFAKNCWIHKWTKHKTQGHLCLVDYFLVKSVYLTLKRSHICKEHLLCEMSSSADYVGCYHEKFAKPCLPMLNSECTPRV